VLGLLLVAAGLGLSNFAAAIGIGLSGLDAGVRLRVGMVFGAFEAAMPLLGLVLGHRIAHALGGETTYVGGGLLIATGCYTLWQARRSQPDHAPVGARLGPLIVTGASLSIDNLVVGFALGSHKVSIPVAAVVIAIASVTMSLVGLELGERLEEVAEKWSEEIGGVVLILVGLAIGAGLL